VLSPEDERRLDAWVRDTADLLQAGLSPREVLLTAVYAVAQGAAPPFGPHGGPLPVLASLRTVLDLEPLAAQALTDQPWLLALQVAAAAQRCLHSPEYAPYRMPDLGGLRETTPERTAGALRRAFLRRQPLLAERYFLGLAGQPELAAGELARAGLRAYPGDEQKLIAAVECLDAVELLPDANRATLMRPVVRANAFPPYSPLPEHEIARVERLASPLAGRSSAELNLGGVRRLRDELREAHGHALPDILAETLRSGVALPTALDAMMAAACHRFLAVEAPGPAALRCMTGLSALRIAAERYLHPDEQAAALLQWTLGPETRGAWADPAEPWIPSGEWAPGPQVETDLGAMLAAGDGEAAAELILIYGEEGADPSPVLRALVSAVAQHPGQDLEALQHAGAMIREFQRGTEDWRWVCLAAAARSAAESSGTDSPAPSHLLTIEASQAVRKKD